MRDERWTSLHKKLRVVFILSTSYFASSNQTIEMQEIYGDNIFTLPIFHGAGKAGAVGSVTTDMHEIPKRRRLTSHQKSPETIAVYQDYGAYYVDLYLGTPPQRQTVLVDTGSAGTALPCSDCLDCGESNHTNTNFAQQLSSSFQELNCSGCFKGRCNIVTKTCDMLSHYAEGSSWHGIEVEDVVYPGGFHDVALDSHRMSEDDDDVNAGSNPKNAVKYRFPFKFSCMKSMEGAFKNQQANGIMGLGLKDTSIWQQMYASGNLKSKQFSMCLRKHPFTQVGKMVRPVGALTFGGVDSRLNSSEMKYVEFKNSDDLYGVHMNDIFVHPGGGETLSDLNLSKGMHRLDISEKTLNAGFMILDSGTTETILPSEIRPALDKVWKQLTGIDFPSSPVDITPEEMRKWPTIIFSMKSYATEGNEAGSTLITFPPSHYMLYDFHNKQYLPRMQMHNNFKGRYVRRW